MSKNLYRQAGSPARILPAGLALLLWMAAAASLVVWGLRWWQIGQYRPSHVVALGQEGSRAEVPANGWRVLSPAASPAGLAETPAAGAWKLLGVVAAAGGQGSALLSHAGEPPRTWRVGQSLDGQWRLQRVAKGRAWLAPVGGDSASAAMELSLQASSPAPAANPGAAPAGGAQSIAQPSAPAAPVAPAPAPVTPPVAVPGRD